MWIRKYNHDFVGTNIKFASKSSHLFLGWVIKICSFAVELIKINSANRTWSASDQGIQCLTLTLIRCRYHNVNQESGPRQRVNWRLITFSLVDVILLVVIAGQREREVPGTSHRAEKYWSSSVLLYECFTTWYGESVVWSLTLSPRTPFISHQTYYIVIQHVRNVIHIEFLIISVWFISQNVTVLTNYNNILKRSRSVKMVTLDAAPPWPLGASLTVLDIVIIPILNNPG